MFLFDASRLMLSGKIRVCVAAGYPIRLPQSGFLGEEE
jgi:hypothetical protein